MRTLETIKKYGIGLASKQFKAPAKYSAQEEDLYRKHGIESVQALELLSRLEEHVGIELPDHEFQGVSDFHALAERIQSRL